MNRREMMTLFLCGLATGCSGGNPSPTPTPTPGPTPTPIPGTHVSFVSDPGDLIGQGMTRSITNIDAEWKVKFQQASFNSQILQIEISKIDINNFQNYILWNLRFKSPLNMNLTAGVYGSAERYPFESEGRPGMSIDIDGRGCNTVTGSFTIHHIDGDINGVIRSLHLTFEQHCNGINPALRGEIIIEPI